MHAAPPSPSQHRYPPALAWVGVVALALAAGALPHLPGLWSASVDARAYEVARTLCPPATVPSPDALEAEASAVAARELAAELNARLSLLADALGAR